MSYAVIIRSNEDPDIKNSAHILAKLRRVPFIDAMRVVRDGWGILEEGSGEASARELAAAFREGGLSAFALPGDGIVRLPEPARVKSLSWDAAGLGALCPPDEKVPIPLESLSLITAGVMGTSSPSAPTAEAPKPGAARRMQTMALNAFIPGAGTVLGKVKGGMDRPIPKTAETDQLFIAELFWGDPIRRLRIDGSRLRYDFLGDRMGPGAFQNFVTLVKGLAALAPGALAGKGVRVLAAGRPVRDMGYRGLEDLERESRALLTPAP